MLYDQALLARTYLHAWQQVGEARWRQVLDETITYVLRDLRQPEGGFSSAEDADSEGEEGRFYVWRVEEIEEVLGSDLAARAIEWYGVTKSGNFEGSNILHRPVRGDLERPPEIEEARRRLFEAREHRVRPGLDDKVLTEWNGLMLDALARAAAATGRTDWLDAAIANADFLLANVRRDDGRWLRSWQRDGGAASPRVRGRLRSPRRRRSCRSPRPQGSGGGSTRRSRPRTDCSTSSGTRKPAACSPPGSTAKRSSPDPKDLLDNATPSANSLAALGLLRLAALTGERRYLHHAEQILALVGSLAATHPLAFPELLSAVDFHRSGATEIAIVGDRGDLVEAVHSRYLPNAVVAWGEPYDSPLWESRRDGFAYVCRDYACLAPVDSVDALVDQLASAAEPSGLTRWTGLGGAGRGRAAGARVSLTLAGFAQVDDTADGDRRTILRRLDRRCAARLERGRDELGRGRHRLLLAREQREWAGAQRVDRRDDVATGVDDGPRAPRPHSGRREAGQARGRG